MEEFEPCEMCTALLTLLDTIEFITEDNKVLEMSRQRFDIAESFGLKVIFNGKLIIH